MYINGVILVSPTGLGIDRSGPVSGALKLPYYTAAAWHHKALAQDLLSRDLEDILPEVEEFTLDKLLPAISRGGFLEEEEKEEIASKMSYYSGLSKKSILQHNLVVPTSFYWKDLLRDKGLTIGRLDSRYRGTDRQDAGERYEYDQASSSWSHAFAPAINMYMKDHLNFKTNTKYNVYGSVSPWSRGDDNTGDNLGEAMAKNPFMHVMIQSGYYDGGCDYFSAKYTMWQIDKSGKLKDRFSFKGYRSGHMMYLRQQDLKTSNEDIRIFIKKSIPPKGQPAKY
jgi:carboxypeptidase C (cathepsin A)